MHRFHARRSWRVLSAAATLLSLALAIGAAPSLAEDNSPKLEPWADQDLPVTEGLYLWLDASRYDDIMKALGGGGPNDGDAIDRWLDGSGARRHLHTPNGFIRPTFHSADGLQSIHFNGRNDYLTLTTEPHSAQDVTVFVVAAPYSSLQPFSALVSMNEKGANDFVTGLNIDFGMGAPSALETLNVEGAGIRGISDLLQDRLDYGAIMRVCVTSSPGKDGVKVSVNGKQSGKRDREPASAVRMDQISVGARYYGLGAAPAHSGFFDGEIAEVLIYDRALSADEIAKVDAYLAAKYKDIPPLMIPGGVPGSKKLVQVPNPPPVQMFVPGFVAKELPFDLTNINNVLYRPDGKLVALAYDGNIYLLTDTDGDGLEDAAQVFWKNEGSLRSPIGMDLTPPGYEHGDGVFVAAKGRCSLIVDVDGDDQADKEIIVADGWKEIPHGVDALGVAFDPRDGSVYLGIGTLNFTNPYGVARESGGTYPLDSERGTILRIAPDFKSREIFATGIRFPVGIRMNKLGDLFCTDQEGATWVPNGNPFDELLHVQKGRHYGFPARHPRFLPNVIDEPSVFDYRPQHQSTCGLNFNEPVNGGPTFGPDFWKEDVIVSGYSRAKLYRTKLVKTDAGYVAQNQMFACLNMLTADACVSPEGALVVAAHTGLPDWGTGAKGQGKLYKIFYEEKDLPQPVMAWAQSPREVRIAFDRPVDPALLAGVRDGAMIEYGRYVVPGDRFETLRPPYQVVQNQLRSPRFELPIYSVQLDSDGRTLILATETHPEAVSYAITLPGLGRSEEELNPSDNRLPQYPQTDLQYELSGVQAEWRAESGDASWAGWLPHVDLAVARKFTAGSAAHEAFFETSQAAGKLTLRTNLVLDDMLRPAVQPGSRIDFEWPEEIVNLRFVSSTSFNVKVGDKSAEATADGDRGYSATISLPAKGRVPMEAVVATAAAPADFRVEWSTNEDDRPRALPLVRLHAPWAPEEGVEAAPLAAIDAPELQGGDWDRGRALFFGEEAICSKCHTYGGKGGSIGPDLSNLPHRDYQSVLRDVSQPSAAINPDYITQIVVLDDGRQFTGSVRTQGDKLLIGDAQGKVIEVDRSSVEEMQPSKLSIMPEDLVTKLGPEKTRDLLTFLLTPAPMMPDYGGREPPPARTQSEIDAILDGAEALPDELNEIRIVLVAGRKDHGPGEHDYPAWQKTWRRLLAHAEKTIVETADEWPSEEQLKTADVLVFYQQGQWTPERAKDLDAFLARGGGAVYIHYAVDGGKDAPGFAKRIGLAWQGLRSKFRHGPLDLGFLPNENHPIARNFDKLHLHDESYWQLVGDKSKITLLATGKEDGEDQPLFWTMTPSNGRVFVSIPGHFSWTFDDPLFRILLLRGIAWTANEPVDRFNGIVTLGARVQDGEATVAAH